MAGQYLLNNRVFISVWVSADDKNSSANIVQVGRILFTCFVCGRVDEKNEKDFMAGQYLLYNRVLSVSGSLQMIKTHQQILCR